MRTLLNKLMVGAAVILALLPNSSPAAPISEQQASNAVLRATALHYPATATGPGRFLTPLGWSQRSAKRVERMTHENQVVAYAVSLEPAGYYLMAADDELPPWKLRSDEGTLDNLPPGLLTVLKLEMAEDQQALAELRKHNQSSNPKFRKQWQSLFTPSTQDELNTNAPTASAGSFLLATTWNQGTAYNGYCPAASGGPDAKAWAGCTAAALAQILRYHNQPTAVSQDRSYTDSSGSCQGTHSISDVGLSAYDWADMPNSIDSGSPLAQKQAVGKLMYHAAVALGSDFEANGTSAYPSDVPSVYRNNFSYTCNDLEWKSSYSSAQWYNKIAADIDANRPVFYAMWQSDWTAGHAVVCDGYQNGNEIHINLGWSGSGNAWYNIDSINYGYTWTMHSAVFGITPPPRATLPNDQCSGAIALVNGGTASMNTMSATATSDPTPSCGYGVEKGVWYKVTPTASTDVTVSTCGSDFDTVLAVYSGDCASLTKVACNDDNGPSCVGLAASVSFAATANTTYYILVGGYSRTSGNLQISAQWSASAPRLNLTRSGTGVVLTWPTNAQGYTLQYATNLSSMTWASNTTTPAIVGGFYSVTDNAQDKARFYRLMK